MTYAYGNDLPATAAQAAFDRQLGWDDQGRVMSIADLANAALSASYGYDGLDRLASAAQGASSWGYTYNGIGDRLTSIAGGATTTYGYASGTHRLQSLSGAQARSYSFDAAGNMTSDGNLTWVYGGHNRPTAIGPLAIHVNALGQRVKKQGPTSATVFAYDEAGRLWGEYTDGGALLQEDGGALLQETVWLDDLPVATLRPSATGADVYYVHTDHLGTPRAVTRPADNQFVWRWDNTEPFGSAPADENPGGLGVFAFNLRFPGQYFDAETGTHYNYFRDYDPGIGRYVQSDPIGLRGGRNTYGYVGANPLLEIDPRGLMGQGASGGSAAPGPYGFGGSGARRRVSTQCFLVCMTLKTAIGFSGGFGLSKGLRRLRPNVTNFAKALIDTIEDFGFRPINSLPGLIGSELISAWVCQDICVDPQKCTPETDDSLLGDARKVWRAVSEDVRHFTSQ